MANLARISAVLILLVVACKDVKSGVVIGKDYNPPYTYITQVCGMYKSNGTCQYYYPQINYVDASWTLELRDDSEDKPVDQQDTGWVEVDSVTFGKYQTGDHYP